MVMTVNEKDIQNLYSEESVADYVSEIVNIILNSGKVVNATVYNLPEESLSGTNREYARSLLKLGNQLGFPESYLDKIRKFTY
jgi:hypothetical protein